MTTKPTADNAGQAAAVYAAECAKLREERDRLRADLNAAKTALENQIAHTTEIANLCARQRAWIDGVMAQGAARVYGHDAYGFARIKFPGDEPKLGTELITRPAPFEDK
jgi:hypothetical protein